MSSLHLTHVVLRSSGRPLCSTRFYTQSFTSFQNFSALRNFYGPCFKLEHFEFDEHCEDFFFFLLSI